MLKKSIILIPALLIATLSGCMKSYEKETRPSWWSNFARNYQTKGYLNTNLIENSHDATDELQDKLTRKMSKDTLIVVSTLLNVKNLKETSAFGRIISNQIATSLHESGYQIIGMDLPADVFMMTESGGLELPDKDQAILRKYKAVIMVGGVYAAGKQHVYVSLRAVDRFTKQMVASTDFPVILGPDVKMLLKNKDEGVIAPAGTIPEPPVEGAIPSGNDSAASVESISPAMAVLPSNTAPAMESVPPKLGVAPPAVNDPALEGEPATQQEKPAEIGQ